MHDESDLSLTIGKFCKRNNMSRGQYYKMRAQGLAPKEMHLGRKVLISIEAAREWRRRIEELTATEASR